MTFRAGNQISPRTRWAPVGRSRKYLRHRFWVFGILTLAVTSACAVAPSAGSVGPSGSQPTDIVAGSSSDASSLQETATAASLPDCDPSALPTRRPGVMAIATGEHTNRPWFTSDDLASSDGFEASVAREVAATLGYGSDKIEWLRVDTESAVAGAVTNFDLLIDRVTDQPTGNVGVDLSAGYYSITDALLMPRAVAERLSDAGPDLGSLRLGVIPGSNWEGATADSSPEPSTVDSLASGLEELRSGEIDGLVLPTPNALDLVAADGSLSVVGQLPAGRWQPDQFHLVLVKNSPLTPCVSAAVDRLRIEGTIETLTQRWITGPLAPQLG